MSISAQQVKELRESTGAKMMDCKKALVETDGDMQKAVDFLRSKSQASADKQSTKVAGEGLVVVKVSEDNNKAVMLEVNSQTDFVAKDASFIEFVNKVAAAALENSTGDMDLLKDIKLADGKTVEQARVALVAILGENLVCRRIELYLAGEGENLGTYVHNSKIAVLVKTHGADLELAKDMAMQVAASNPLVIDPSDVPQELVEKEKQIFTAQSKDSGKPDNIIEKMIIGRISKFVNEQSLVGQDFIKDSGMKVSKVLSQANAKVISFSRFMAGEGIEKAEDNFAQEVMAQAFGEADS